ncbi:MAG: polysaccharide biosynthesis tyrosine autokinase [Candidatus Andeanibacterium colombiense]|uniref:non-specific protein-tyrosine kinase n=1 Tax=Candidatus Andeanibacterium colombiense TaxID=3121345 RepID=A0AAJ5X479_9SPHN|nr:MAG: polysaccharide biosynthesis tyrosine autokinase [Sphingomonadaceae bacterium]
MNTLPPDPRAQAAALDPEQQPYGLPVGIYGTGALGELMRYVLALVRRNRWLILAVIGLALIAALVATMLDTPRYTATTSIQINDQSEQVLGEELDSQASELSKATDVERFLNTQVDIMRSRGLAERVARRLELIGNARFYAALEVPAPSDSKGAAERREQVLGLLQKNLTVSLPRNSRIATISFSSADPDFSAKIANAFAEEFIQANLQRRFDSSAYARTFISEQLEEARVRLEGSEREVNAYARNAGLIRTRDNSSEEGAGSSSGGLSSVTTSSLMQINQATNQATAERIAAEGRWRTIQSSRLLSSEPVLANPTVQQLMTQRAVLEADLKKNRSRYLDGHPSIIQGEAQLASVNQQLNQVANNVRDSVKADYTAALASEQRLSQQVNQLQGATLAEQDRAVRYNTLAREADTNRSLYDGLLQRFRELNAAAGIATSNLAIIDRADRPLRPSSPNLPFNLAIALLVGVGIAAVLVFVRDQLDDLVRIPEDVEEKIQLPLLGIIPDSQSEDPAIALADPKSAISEAYGSLRGALLYSSRSGLPKVVLVTSAQPTEGKSTSAFALAAGFARMGRKVLLVDADMRRPSVHHRIGNDNRRGLSSLLVSDDPARSALVVAALPNLDLLPSGPIPPSPTELLTSPRMAALLDEFAGQYDVVLVDSPPVLGLADAPALAALSDGVVFVIESERGRRGALKTALKRLRAVHAVLLGAVLTKFDPDKSGNRYSEYYGYSYYRYEAGESASG